MIQASNNKYDLEERTSKFGQDVICLCKKVTENTISKPIISQLVRSATSVGANYMEANGASSKKDFINKIHICRKEVQETKHWLKMLLSCSDNLLDEIMKLSDECRQLILIFQSISTKAKEKK